MPVPSVEIVQTACEYAAQKYRERGGPVFVQDVYDNVKVTKVYDDDEGVRTVEFRVATPEKFDNAMNMVHGGASSTFCAIFSMLALAGDDKLWSSANPTTSELENYLKVMGVTRSMDVQILQAVPLRTEVYVRCKLFSRTKSNAFVGANIYNQSGRLLVRASHDMIRQGYEPQNPDDPQHFHARFRSSKL